MQIEECASYFVFYKGYFDLSIEMRFRVRHGRWWDWKKETNWDIVIQAKVYLCLHLSPNNVEVGR